MKVSRKNLQRSASCVSRPCPFLHEPAATGGSAPRAHRKSSATNLLLVTGEPFSEAALACSCCSGRSAARTRLESLPLLAAGGGAGASPPGRLPVRGGGVHRPAGPAAGWARLGGRQHQHRPAGAAAAGQQPCPPPGRLPVRCSAYGGALTTAAGPSPRSDRFLTSWTRRGCQGQAWHASGPAYALQHRPGRPSCLEPGSSLSSRSSKGRSQIFFFPASPRCSRHHQGVLSLTRSTHADRHGALPALCATGDPPGRPSARTGQAGGPAAAAGALPAAGARRRPAQAAAGGCEHGRDRAACQAGEQRPQADRAAVHSHSHRRAALAFPAARARPGVVRPANGQHCAGASSGLGLAATKALASTGAPPPGKACRCSV